MSEFAATRWSCVARAKGCDSAARNALCELCEAYYEPVVSFLCCEGRPADDARDLAHEFFATLLAGGSLGGAHPARGRFRNYLLGALKHFLADRRDRANAAKRGGGAAHQPIDPESARSEAPDDRERAFDRQWAFTVISRALATVGGEFEAAGKSAQFEAFKPSLTTPGFHHADAARRLGLSEGAAKVAIHRLRQRFREAVKSEITDTVPTESDTDQELQYLLAVLIG